MTQHTPESLAAFEKWIDSDSALDLRDCPFEYLRDAFASAFTSRQQEIDMMKQQRDELQKELEARQYEIKYACDRITEHSDNYRKLAEWRDKAIQIHPALYSFLDEAIAKAGEA